MVREENLENAECILEKVKEDGIHPILVTCDLSPNILGAIEKVYGEEVIQIDGFHVMRELNNGIKRDLLDFREKKFKIEIKDLQLLRDWVNLILKGMQENGDFSISLKKAGMPPNVNPIHSLSLNCSKLMSKLLEILKIEIPKEFFNELLKVISEADPNFTNNEKNFFSGLFELIPKKKYSEKGRNRVKSTILRKLKSHFLKIRSDLENKSKNFFKDHWVIFFQPKKLTQKRKEKLELFLNTYPELQIYRNITLMVGEIYRLPIDKIDGHQIDDLKESPNFSDKLNTAICTLKKHKAKILRFVEVFKKYPNLPKACRSNMEYYNLRFKKPFKRGNNLTKKERLISKLNMQFYGKVEWFLEDKVLV